MKQLDVSLESQLDVDDRVRLTQDLPERELRQGQLGVVCSGWFHPMPVYEVEFEPLGLGSKVRALIPAHQIRKEITGGAFDTPNDN